MAGELNITMVGNLTNDPELRFTQTGRQVVGFTVAQTASRFNRDSNSFESGDTVFMRCSAWGELAENIAKSLSKGNRVVVTGRLASNTYKNNEGHDVRTLDLTVDEIGPSLRYATANVTRIPHDGANASGYGASGGNNADMPNANVLGNVEQNNVEQTPLNNESAQPPNDVWANDTDSELDNVLDSKSNDDLPF